MNLRKLKNQAGFTLVELIVVIAIMAILAGVAVPVYSGYIEKANKAADLQLLDAVNGAFAAACVEGGADVYAVTDATLTYATADKGAAITGIASVSGDGLDDAVVKEAFARYYAGNTGSVLKSTDALEFNDQTHLFEVPGTGSNTMKEFTYTDSNGNKVTVKVPQAAIDALKESAWGTVGTDDLLALVGNVSDMATAIDNETFLAMLEDPDYLAAAAEALGVKPEEYDDTVTGMIESAAEKYLQENPGASEDEVAEYMDSVGAQIIANNAILVAAKNSKESGATIMDLLTADGGKNAKESIKQSMANDPAAGLSQAALAYGLYSSYKLSTDPDSFDPNAPMDFLAVLNTMEDPGFQQYLTEGNGQKDLDGYLAALDTVGSNTGEGSSIGTDVVVGGFNNDELADLLGQIMGN